MNDELKEVYERLIKTQDIAIQLGKDLMETNQKLIDTTEELLRYKTKEHGAKLEIVK